MDKIQPVRISYRLNFTNEGAEKMSAMVAKTVLKKFSYADYEKWSENSERCEIIDGVIVAMSAPSRAHQFAVGEIFGEMRNFFKGRKCTPYVAPVDVRLFPKGLDDTVVQPDIVVICDPKKFSDGKSCQGAPDLIVEVISKTTLKQDRLVKFRKYEQAGVLEYWLVDPTNYVVEIFVLEANRFVSFDIFDEADEFITSRLFEGLKIRTADIFEKVIT
jgi:Uma2 family endonuclease